MSKKIITLLLCLSTFFLQAAEKPLVVGTNSEFPPFSYLENREIVGFDIDVAKEVARRLGRTIQFKDMPFDALIPDIILGRLDVVAAGMSYTPERAKRVLFTEPYFSEDPLVIFTKNSQAQSLEALKGKIIVVIEGYTADQFMSAKQDVKLLRLPVQADGFMAIKSGRAEAFVTAKTTAEAFLKNQDASQFYMTALEGTGDTCALVVPKSKPDLLVEVQKALDEMKEDGTLDQLKTKWKFL